MNEQPRRIAFAGAKTSSLEVMTDLIDRGHRIDLLVSLSPTQAERHVVSGYTDLTDFASAHAIEMFIPETYALSAEADRVALLAQHIDCVLVTGWQRLIPDWWLATLSRGAFGMHGSPEPLPRGRGRSPMNWALKAGKKSFVTNLFRYDAGVDSGGIVGSQRFDINMFDDCASLHLKNRMAMSRLLDRHLPSILDGTATTTPQRSDLEPTYLPKRTPDDGRIDWLEVDMDGLYNHVRCQTRPFPGAFSHLDGGQARCYFWRVAPFDTHIDFPESYPGTVAEVFHDGTFLVTVWDGSVRVLDYEGQTPARGQRFGAARQSGESA